MTMTLDYNYIKSGEFVGDLVVYDSKYSKSILIKKGELIEAVKSAVQKVMGTKYKVSLYCKNEAACSGFFLGTVRNSEKQKCINVLQNGEAVLMPIEKLDKQMGSLTAILRSGKLVKHKKQHTLYWKLTICELQIEPIPKEYEAYFKVAKKPKISFFGK